MKRALLLASALLGTPAMAAPTSGENVHVVRDGETLNGIANRAGVSRDAIVRANSLKAPYVVRVGQKLDIPRKGEPALAPTDAAAKGAVKTAARVITERVPSAPVTSPETETLHIVRPGETLGGIAVRAKVPRVLIAEANGLQPPYAVRSGQKLQIPRTRRHKVVAGDTAFSISMQYGVSWEQVALANSFDPAAPVKVGQRLLIPTLLDPPVTGAKPPTPAPLVFVPPAKVIKPPRFSWPLDGDVRRGYAPGKDYHDGLDITAPKGAMVRAAASGTVKFAGEEKDQFGNLVVLDHGDGWFTAYGFLSRVTVKEGAKVAVGERIGLVGNTGRAKGNELHFEMRRDGKPVDPLNELPKQQQP